MYNRQHQVHDTHDLVCFWSWRWIRSVANRILILYMEKELEKEQ